MFAMLKMPPRERTPGVDDLARLLSDYAAECRALADRLDQGLPIEQWREEFDALLTACHRDAYTLGHLRSSGAEPADGVADEVARAMRDLESYFAARFENDLREGLEPGPARRMAMYGGRARGTANGGWVDGCEPNEMFDWNLGTDDNCEDCPIYAANGPYDKGSLPAVPGDNSTPCLFNCKCTLTRASDGQSGFDPVNVWDSEDE